MANVEISQRHAHLAGDVRLEFVEGRGGRVAKGSVTVISNTRWGSGDARRVVATAVPWTLWDSMAENAAEYLSKGSHVNIKGRVTNNNYEKEGGEMVYRMEFTAEEIDYLDSRADAEARRRDRQASHGGDADRSAWIADYDGGAPRGTRKPTASGERAPRSTRRPATSAK